MRLIFRPLSFLFVDSAFLAPLSHRFPPPRVFCVRLGFFVFGVERNYCVSIEKVKVIKGTGPGDPVSPVLHIVIFFCISIVIITLRGIPVGVLNSQQVVQTVIRYG